MQNFSARTGISLAADSTDGYQVKGTLSLGMFDLLPTNSIDGTLYGVRSDGNIVAAVPR